MTFTLRLLLATVLAIGIALVLLVGLSALLSTLPAPPGGIELLVLSLPHLLWVCSWHAA